MAASPGSCVGPVRRVESPDGEAVALRYGEDQALPRQRHRRDGTVRQGGRRAHEREVYPVRLQGLDLLAGDHLLQGEIDFGQAVAQVRDQAREGAIGGGGGEAEADHSALPPRRPAGDALRILGRRDHPVRLRHEGASGGGQAHRPGGAFQQRDAQRLLQHLDLPGERRLRQIQPRGGPAEMQFLGHRDEAAGVSQIEH